MSVFACCFLLKTPKNPCTKQGLLTFAAKTLIIYVYLSVERRIVVKKMINIKKFLMVILAALMCLSVAPYTVLEEDMNIKANASAVSYSLQAYTGPYSSVDGTYGGVDDMGRYLTADYQTTTPRAGRYVGIFYFLWQGEHGTAGPYDNTKIVANNPNAIKSEANWIASGGGAQQAHHFWGEPLFGYYKSNDTWVMRKHVQMLTDAGVDFICFDATNGYTYTARVKELIAVWYEYLLLGYNVPKLVFYTNTVSGQTMNAIYNDIYNNAALKAQYPRLDELWFKWDGKPLIIGDSSDPVLSSAAKNYFRIKANQWPNESRKADGFPWMEFSRVLTSSSVYGLNGRKEVMNVSIAQHNATIRFSATAWYGGNDRSRSWHNGANDKTADAYMYGHNFAEQWDYAIKQDPEMIFVTGWNEWVAQRQPVASGQPIVFVDCADYNTSRDSEPMRGYYGDNYYMQLIDYIRKYKGTISRVYVGNDTTIDMAGSFTQWNSSAITARYTDYKNDTVNRNTKGFGDISYVNTTGRNDIVKAYAAKDANNFYFYVETANNLTSYTDKNWMTLFLSVGVNDNPNWYGYNYAVNIDSPVSSTKAYLYQSQGGWDWARVGSVKMKIEGNKMMVAVPRSSVGATGNLFHVEFKWADNYTDNDIWSFYTDGDTAPYGRLNYVFSNSKKVASSGSDTGSPIAKDIKIVQNGTTSYTISCTVDDDKGISHVYFPTWTDTGWQDDIKWVAATISGRTAKATINASDFGNAKDKYITHVYVYDKAGNSTFAGERAVHMESTKPVISDVKFSDISSKGYTVTCTVTDDSLSYVKFPTWTVANGQDDIKWLDGTINGSTVTCRVNTSDFGNAVGAYATHVYAYDTSGNEAGKDPGTINVKDYDEFALTSSAASKYTLDTVEGYVYKLPAGTKLSALKTYFQCDIKVYDGSGKALTDTAVVATNFTLEGVETVDGTPTVKIVVEGDVTMDGSVTVADYASVRNHLGSRNMLTGAYIKAADFDGSNHLNTVDLLTLRKLLAK